MKIVFVVIVILSQMAFANKKLAENKAEVTTSESVSKSPAAEERGFLSEKTSNYSHIFAMDLIGATKGLTQVSIENKLTDKNFIVAHLSSRLIENDDKSVRSTEAKGLLLGRHITGEFGKAGIQIGIGPMGYIDFDSGKLSKGLAFVGYLGAQILLGNQIVVRIHALASNTSVVGGMGLHIGAAF